MLFERAKHLRTFDRQSAIDLREALVEAIPKLDRGFELHLLIKTDRAGHFFRATDEVVLGADL